MGGVCVFAVTLISAHFVLDAEPESRTLASSDGVVQVKGRVYESQHVTLEEEAVDGRLSPLGEKNYRILPEDTVFVQPLTLSFSQSTPAYTALYRWNDHEGYWLPLQENRDSDGQISFALFEGGTYAPGFVFSVVAPTFVDMLSGLRMHLPLNAVSYTIKSVVTPQGGVPILLDAAVEEGGCGGVPAHSESSLFSQDEQTVEVLVNDVLTPTVFTFILEIGTAPQGCPEDMPLKVIE